ncbi:MAG: ATP-binding protein [Nostocoides sp.]
MVLPDGFLGLVHPDDKDAARRLVLGAQARPHDPLDALDLRVQDAQGSYLTCSVDVEDLTLVASVGGILVRVADVTQARQHAREVAHATARMRTLIDNLDSAVLLEDENRRVLVTNEAFVQMFEVRAAPDDLVGADCSGAADAAAGMFADPAAFVAGVNERVATAAPVRGERLVLVDGGVLERDYLPIVSHGRPAGHMWAYRDITQQIDENRLLADQNRSLAQLAALKNEFVARVSHELRSPLTSVVSFAELLADPSTGPLNSDQREFVNVVVRNADRLLRLIEDLLLLAKLESHTLPLNLGLVDLGGLIDQVLIEQGPAATAASITLNSSCSPGSRVRGDALRLHQVVTNLVQNAIRYTPQGGRVEVRLALDPERHRWQLDVTDTGVGIAPEDSQRMFDAFYRAEHTTQGGTGLGLAIVRLIIDEHGGEVRVTSTPGEGTTMTVRLPAEAA